MSIYKYKTENGEFLINFVYNKDCIAELKKYKCKYVASEQKWLIKDEKLATYFVNKYHKKLTLD